MTIAQTNAPNDWQVTAAEIRVDLGRDPHQKNCDLAKAGGPDATLACANCGRAAWMHSTRHDTCGQFCWVTERSITERQIGQLAAIENLPLDLRRMCAQALNDYGLAPYFVREARQTCSAAINNAKRVARRTAPRSEEP